MATVLTIIVFVLIFSVLVLIHEAGHFWAAKREGIKVEEFGFGLPPRIWGKKKGDTIYSINWIPFGGFVRLKGEDAHDPKYLHDPESFSSKTKWQRFKVVVAGVVMNFILAFVLLSFGFTVGMEPLIVNREDFQTAINNGTMQLESGMVVKEVEKDSNADKLGFKPGDNVLGFVPKGEAEPKKDYIEDVANGVVGAYRVVRGQNDMVIEATQPMDGLTFYPTYSFPAVKVLQSDHQWFTKGAVIVRSAEDGASQRLLAVEDFKSLIGDTPDKEKAYPFIVMSPEVGFEAKVPLNNVNKTEYKGVLIREVMPGSPAEKAGIKPMDKIFRVGENDVKSLEDFVKYTGEHKGEETPYLVETQDRGYVDINVTPDSNGKIGAAIEPLFNVYAGLDGKFVLYLDETPTSIIKVQDVQYPFYQAPWQALKEMGRLSLLTTKMFGTVIGDLLTGNGVPDSVSGPVGIYHQTGVVVQEGLFATLRFVALLSLSLAVINILPFPALDGGRILFILIELVIRRRVPQKWEAYIHSIGFILLLLLILAVTYSDILRIFIS